MSEKDVVSKMETWIEAEVSVSVLASVRGCQYKILAVLPNNILNVEFKVNSKETTKIKAYRLASSGDYVLIQTNGRPFVLVRETYLESTAFIDLESELYD